MRPKILISRRLPQAAVDRVARDCDVDHNEANIPLKAEELKQRLQGKQGLICLLTDKITDELLDGLTELKVVANVAVGYDNIDVPAATRRGIMVTNTPEVLTETTADFTWALLMAVARRVVEGDAYARSGEWKEWMLLEFLGSDVYGKTLGIMGLGRIGRAVARRAAGFNMRMLYHDAFRPAPAVERELKVEYRDKESVLREADFVTLHTPLIPETRHYISTKELRLMKRTAFLINASRGPVLDEEALAQALKEGVIAGAALDVFEQEPKIHPGLIGMRNVVLAPHLASASIETRTAMSMLAADNAVAAVLGQRPPTLVNPEVWKG
ncbi:MAG: D-glycerate dehydrogenase [Deltaproteobacteria bacterium]|nr:D-glycerate dehydrogenase [Deltaproteobacteria bacterium]